MQKKQSVLLLRPPVLDTDQRKNQIKNRRASDRKMELNKVTFENVDYRSQGSGNSELPEFNDDSSSEHSSGSRTYSKSNFSMCSYDKRQKERDMYYGKFQNHRE